MEKISIVVFYNQTQVLSEDLLLYKEVNHLYKTLNIQNVIYQQS